MATDRFNPFKPPAKTKRGDVWQLDSHRLMCGDSTDKEDVKRLMRRKKADLCFTSPPYGQQREYGSVVKRRIADWDALMNGVFSVAPLSENAQVLVNLGLIHRQGEWQPYWSDWIESMRAAGWRRFGWYVWDQCRGLPGDWNGRLAPSFEFVFHFNRKAVKPNKFIRCIHAGEKRSPNSTILRKPDGSKIPTSHADRPIQDWKIPDSVIRIHRRNTGGIEHGHPAIFPVTFAEFGLQCWPGLVYEPFSGSGSTIIAAEKLGGVCYAMELNPEYVDIAVQRWQQNTGRSAHRVKFAK